MRIQPGDVIAGQPALAIRKLLKREKGTIAIIAEVLDVDLVKARQVYQGLSDEEYIMPSDRPYEAEEGAWRTTRKGNALANATARKPITRRTAERLIQEFLHRVREVNACDDYVYRVKQVILFGSYLGDSLSLGDVDLSLVLEFREHDPHQRDKQIEARINQALRNGKRFQNYTNQIFWPYTEVFSILKGHSPSLSLHDDQLEQVLSQPIPSKILFDATVDEKS